jgi:amino-acid N-acetyltransferase
MSDIPIRAALPTDRAQVLALLADADLSSGGVAADLAGFVVAEDQGRVVGVAGLERYERDGLLRSVAVAESHRGSGLGARLTHRVVEEAESRGLEGLYALTTTAEWYFPRLGFERITREQVPGPVRSSEEFRTICPSNAVALRRLLASPV